MKRTIIFFAVLLLVSSNLFSQSENAIHFDGVNDYAYNGISYSNNFSVMTMAWPEKVTGEQVLISNYNYTGGINSAGYEIAISNGVLRATLYINGSFTDFFGSIPINAEEWVTVAITVKNNKSYSLYVNGVLDTQATFIGTFRNNSEVTYFGSRDSWSGFFHGRMDETSFWSKVLSQSEIEKYMITPPDPTTKNLLAYYDFNQGTAYGNNGKVYHFSDRTSNSKYGEMRNFALVGYTSNWVKALQPNMKVIGNHTLIENGNNIPFYEDNTHFGYIVAGNSVVTKTYTIKNAGEDTLKLSGKSPYVFLSGNGAADFAITSAPESIIVPGDSTSFDVTFSPTEAGTKTATITLSNIIENEDEYSFRISGVAKESEGPCIVVKGSYDSIENGANNPRFANNTMFDGVFPGSSITKTFYIKNTGTASLTLNGSSPYIRLSESVKSNFKVSKAPEQTILSGDSTSFTITFSPSSQSNQTGSLTIESNSINNSFFSFDIKGKTILGKGSSSNPYQISSLGELKWLSENETYWKLYFIQTDDIDASDTKNWNNGKGFTPIGNFNYLFRGDYNGNGHIINGLYINRSSRKVGLFYKTMFADIQNLGLTNCNITGGNDVGALVGENYASNISNCFCLGSVSGSQWVGGLVGNSNDSDIINCYSSGTVSGTNYVGGLVGYMWDSTIVNSYSTSMVSGNTGAGGIVGFAKTAVIQHTYATGLVSSSDETGVLIGHSDNSTITNSYYNSKISDRTDNYATGLTSEQMKSQAVYTGWDFENTWSIANSTSPALRNIQNAPFAFPDSIAISEASVSVETILAEFLANDYDYETNQDALTAKIISVSAGSITNSTFHFNGENRIEIYYQVGETGVIDNDTLWGSPLKSILTNPNTNPEFQITTFSTKEDINLTILLDTIASDKENEALTFTILSSPLNGTASIESSLLTYSPASDFYGNDSLKLLVSDASGSDSSWLVFQITPVNDAPVIASVASDLSIDEDNSITLSLNNITASDADSDELTLVIAEGENYLLNGSTITPTANYNGILTVPIAVTDGVLNSESMNIIIIVNAVNDAPVITSVASDLSIDEGSSFTLRLKNISTSDVDGDELALVIADGENYLLNGSTIIPTANYNGTLIVPIAVTDGLLNSESMNISIVVNAVNNAPVIASVASDLSIDEDNSITLSLNNVTASDADGDELTMIIAEGENYLLNGLTITPTANYNGTLTVPIAVTDGVLNSESMNIYIVVNAVNDAPVISSMAGTNAEYGKEYAYTVSASDVDGDALTYTLSGEPNGMSISNNFITWTPENGVTTSGEVTLTVSDGELSVSEFFTIAVTESTGVNENALETINLYPNPTNEFIHLKFNNSGTRQLIITDLAGRILSSKIICEQALMVDVSQFNQRTILVHIKEQNQSKKFKVLIN